MSGLYNGPLEQAIIVDTPGLAALSEEGVARTERLLAVRSAEAAAQADALIYLVNGELREDDADVLAAFHQQSDGIGATAINALAVINKADKFGDGLDGLAAAQSRAAAIAHRLGPAVAAVLPLVGLLGESVAVGRVTEARARRLAALAALPSEESARQLVSVRRFMAAGNGAVGPAEREDLVRVFDMLGIRLSIAMIRRGITGAVALSRELERHSGMEELRRLIESRFTARADVLKAAAGLRELRGLAAGDDRGRLTRTLRNAADELALLPEMQLVREMDVLRDVLAREVVLPEELAVDLRRLTVGETALDKLALPDASRPEAERLALEAAGRWRKWGNDARRRPAEQRAARVVTMSYAGIARELAATGS